MLLIDFSLISVATSYKHEFRGLPFLLPAENHSKIFILLYILIHVVIIFHHRLAHCLLTQSIHIRLSVAYYRLFLSTETVMANYVFMFFILELPCSVYSKESCSLLTTCEENPTNYDRIFIFGLG
jgi:hypothetical protein